MKETEFYKIVNADGKCWWMPVRGMRVGLALYQPSGWKGRLLKCLLPYLHWSGLVRRVLKIEREARVMPEELRKAVCEAFGVERFDYSVFGGTPSVHQKTVIQVWNEERILGYVKMSENEGVGRLFFQEMNFLKKITNNRLQITHFVRDFYSARHNEQAPSALANRKNIQMIDDSQQSTVNSQQILTPSATLVPLRQGDNIEGQQLLRCVPSAVALRLESGSWILIQSTRKTFKSEMVREWGMLQEKFLQKLYEATAQEMAWEESDVARSLRDLRERIDWLPDGVDGELVAKRIDAVVERMRGKRVRYGAYHGDFTPWNMFVEGGELFVFDWEYAGMSYPEGLDRYHFWMQTAIHEKHWGAEELRRYICSADGTWIDREMLEMYLLDVMSKYVMREGEKVKCLGAFEVWATINGQ